MLVLILFLLLAIPAAAYGCYRFCFYAPAKRNDDPYAPMEGEQYAQVLDNILATTRIMEKSGGEEISLATFDGLLLHGTYYHTRDGAPVQLMFHGYRSHPWRDCAGGYILAKKMGFNVLITHQRAHVRSGGKTIAFGILERHDCQRWTEYIRQRFGDVPVVLSGLSMGAATVLMASDLPLPGVCGIIADCPYDSPPNIIRKVCRDIHLPDGLCYPFVRLGARLFGGFSLESASALRSVSATQIPILLLHGEDDRFVPCQMSKNILNRCRSSAQLHTFPDAGHGLCYMLDPVRYETVVVRFLWEMPMLRPCMEGSACVQEYLSNEIPLPKTN